jgi:hypothetical protein
LFPFSLCGKNPSGIQGTIGIGFTPGGTLPGFSVSCSYVAGPLKSSEFGIVPTARIFVTAEYTRIADKMAQTATPSTIIFLNFIDSSIRMFFWGTFQSTHLLRRNSSEKLATGSKGAIDETLSALCSF